MIPAKSEKGGPEPETDKKTLEPVSETKREVAGRAIEGQYRLCTMSSRDPVVNATLNLASNDMTEEVFDHVAASPFCRRT